MALMILMRAHRLRTRQWGLPRPLTGGAAVRAVPLPLVITKSLPPRIADTTVSPLASSMMMWEVMDVTHNAHDLQPTLEQVSASSPSLLVLKSGPEPLPEFLHTILRELRQVFWQKRVLERAEYQA